MHIVKVRILNIFRALCCRLFHPEARKISFFSAVCIGVWAPLFAADLPHGGSVTGGQAVITQQTHSVEVFQSSDRVSLLWDEFSIGADKTVNFVQPSSRSIALNTVPNGNISHIHGALKANGRVFLINPSGIVFGSDAQVNVGGLLASTLHLGAQERFFSADESFLFKGESSGSIINNGDLRALNTSGDASVTLIAAQIENYGRITARHVGLAAGSQVRLDLGAGFSIAVEKAAIDAKIEQGGAIQAEGGRLILNAQTANDLLATVVNHAGISEATALTKDAAGDIYLVSNGGVRISENSQLSVAGKKPGRVTIKADHLTQAGKIDASASGAAQAGGEVLLDVSGRFNNSGVITANSASEDGGSISVSAENITETSSAFYQADGFLSGGHITLLGGQTAYSSAGFAASGQRQTGGRIDITAPDTRFLSNSITASGVILGGLVRLGGAFQGGKTPDTAERLRHSFVDRWGSLPDLSSAQSLFVNDGVSIDVSSGKGRGGTAIAWSDQQTTFLGKIMAKGPLYGGSVEISSANNLRYIGLKSIETGPGGHLLLDPKNITLGDAADASGWNYNGIIGLGYTGGKNLDTSGVFSNGDNAGRAVALNAAGDRMAIGALFANASENGGSVSNSGKVFLFSFSDNTFSGGALNATIGLNENFLVEGLSVSDNFGASVAFNGTGDRLAVGAMGDDFANVDEDETDAKAGAVYLFSFTDTNGAISNFETEAVIGKGYSGGKYFSVDTLLGDVDTPGSDQFGTSLALSDDATLLAIGASGDDGATIGGVDDPIATRGTGAVYLFKFDDGSFSGASLEGIIGKNYEDADTPLPQSLNVSSIAKHDAFGRSLAFNGAGNRLAVGAHTAEAADGTQTSSGAVFLFSFSDNAFSGAALEATFGIGYSGGKNFDVSGLEAGDRFGTGVALNTAGDRLAVGAGFDDGSDNSINESGAVYVFAFSDSDFNGATQIGTIGAGYSGDNDVNLSTLSDDDVRVAAKDQFGMSVALNGAGDYLAVGASLNDGAENTSANSGAVYLFHYDAASLPDDAGAFAQQPSDTVIFASSAISDLIIAGTDVTLQASNDITVSSALSVPDGESRGRLTLQAGRSILLNAHMITGNGDLTLVANDRLANGVQDAHRDAGSAEISMADGVSIQAGTGSVSITLEDGAGKSNSASGNISLRTISAATISAVNLGLTEGSGIVLNSGALTASGSGDAIVLSGQSFQNEAGAAALSANSGRWLVWSANEDPFDLSTGDTRGGLLYGFKQYNAIYGTTSVEGSENGFLYTLAPTLSSSLIDSASKTYDGLSNITTLTEANYGAITGAVDGDTVTLSKPTTGILASKNVGENINVSLTRAKGSWSNNGVEVYGYQIAESSGSIALITAKALSVSAPGISDKIYDGTKSAGSVTPGDLSGFVGNERVTATASAFELGSKDIGDYKTTVRYTLVDGANGGLAGNYTLANTADVEARITVKALSVTGVRPPSFVYSKDSSFSLEGNPRIAPYEKDNVSLAGTAIGYVLMADVARDVPVTIAGLTLIGADRRNYSLLFPSGFTVDVVKQTYGNTDGLSDQETNLNNALGNIPSFLNKPATLSGSFQENTYIDKSNSNALAFSSQDSDGFSLENPKSLRFDTDIKLKIVLKSVGGQTKDLNSLYDSYDKNVEVDELEKLYLVPANNSGCRAGRQLTASVCLIER